MSILQHFLNVLLILSEPIVEVERVGIEFFGEGHVSIHFSRLKVFKHVCELFDARKAKALERCQANVGIFEFFGRQMPRHTLGHFHASQMIARHFDYHRLELLWLAKYCSHTLARFMHVHAFLDVIIKGIKFLNRIILSLVLTISRFVAHGQR